LTAVAASEHLTDHVVEDSSMTEIHQLNVCVETYGYVETSPVADLNAQQTQTPQLSSCWDGRPWLGLTH